MNPNGNVLPNHESPCLQPRREQGQGLYENVIQTRGILEPQRNKGNVKSKKDGSSNGNIWMIISVISLVVGVAALAMAIGLFMSVSNQVQQLQSSMQAVMYGINQGEQGAKGEKGQSDESAMQIARLENEWNRKLVNILSNATDCDQLYDLGVRNDGAYNILINGTLVLGYCDFENGGYNWLTFQRRESGFVDFFLKFRVYEVGFGSASGEFWLGLENLHLLTSSRPHRLRVDLEDWNGNTAYAEYSIFSIGNSASNYRLNVGGYSGNAGDALAHHNNRPFSTKDRDNDAEGTNCADSYRGGWWYHTPCHDSNLNGRYQREQVGWVGLHWGRFPGAPGSNSMRRAEMKMRPN